ncbi:MAG: S1C family serine protease [Candidatus Uhrbacteria bacterium]|nr:S1C family serine protease [Candidatus Uhrbacteria bacterium]
MDDALNRVAVSMIAVYDDAQHAQSVEGIASLPTAQSFRGYALALTTDGWLVTTIPIEKALKSYRLISKTGMIYSVVSASADPVAGVSFVKISAKNLHPIQFVTLSDRASVRPSALITGWSSAEQIFASPAAYTQPRTAAEYVHSTKKIDRRILPDTSFEVKCMPAVSDTFEVLGCSAERGIVSFEYIQSALQSLLRTGQANRSDFALSYIDLSQAPMVTGGSEKSQAGAYLQLDVSPQAFQAPEGAREQFFTGDIITHVNDEVLDDYHNLAERVAQYQKGDSISLKVHGKNGDRDIRIKL